MKRLYNFLKYDQIPSKNFVEEDKISILQTKSNVKLKKNNENSLKCQFKLEQSTKKKKILRRQRAEEKLRNLGVNLDEVY